MLPNYRRCLSCRKVAPKTDFWRVIRVFPSRTVQLDHGMGRSVYLCPNASCIQAAQRKDRLGRSLKVTVPEAIYQLLWQRLNRVAQGPGDHPDRPPDIAQVDRPNSGLKGTSEVDIGES